jgi:hypothetical protein
MYAPSHILDDWVYHYLILAFNQWIVHLYEMGCHDRPLLASPCGEKFPLFDTD